MNKNKLKEFVNALGALSDDVKDWDVSMVSEDKPECGTPGCHAGLISIVAKELPEMQDLYKSHFYSIHGVLNESNYPYSIWEDVYEYESNYRYSIWADTLAEFLDIKNRRYLNEWADNNPELWGNKFGIGMFCRWSAFTNESGKKLTHRDIINHWKQVLANIEA